MDIIAQVRYSDTPKRDLIAGRMLTWHRGQMPASIRFLATRWKWGNDKVQRFLDFLVDENLISVSTAQCQTVLTVLSEKQVQQQVQPTGQQQVQLNTIPVRISTDSSDNDEYTKPDIKPDNDRTVTSTKQKESSNKEVIKKNKVEIVYAYSEGGFIETYNEWIIHLKEKGKPITAMALKKQNQFLRKFTVTEAIEIVNSSIMNNYQGLFAPKKINNGNSNASSAKPKVSTGTGITNLQGLKRRAEKGPGGDTDTAGANSNEQPEEWATVEYIDA